MLGIAIILSDEQISKYSSILQDITQSTFYNDLLNNNYEFKPYENNSEMHKNTSGFEYTISLDSPKLVLFTIPFEENGWTAEESGNDIPIEKVDNGLIAIKLDKGIHNVNFKYKTPGLKHGIIITIISSAIFIIYLIVIHKRKETSK